MKRKSKKGYEKQYQTGKLHGRIRMASALGWRKDRHPHAGNEY